jgi:hypothetical protein
MAAPWQQQAITASRTRLTRGGNIVVIAAREVA